MTRILLLAVMWTAACGSKGGTYRDGGLQLEPEDADLAWPAQRCSYGYTLCDGECVSLSSDEYNCGRCGNACYFWERCVSGSCYDVSSGSSGGTSGGSGGTSTGSPCGYSEQLCNGVCIDTRSDGNNCGGCGKVCADDQACDYGWCTKCWAPETACNHLCVELAKDVQNCGACGHACEPGHSCSGGACFCPDGRRACGTVCLDVLTDNDNCGACGNKCEAGLSCVAGFCDAPGNRWRTFGSDAAHSGYNRAETGAPPSPSPSPSPLSNGAWSIALASDALQPPVIENGRVFVTASRYSGTAAPIWARHLADGSEAWTYDFGKLWAVGHPSVFRDTVYVAQEVADESRFYALDATSGKLRWYKSFGRDWGRQWSPLLWGGRAYLGGEAKLHGLDGYGGGLFFTEILTGYYEDWVPAAHDGKIWTFMDGKLRSHDPWTGKVLATATVMTTSSFSYSVRGAPVFDDKHAYVISPPNLYAIVPATGSTAWSANGAIEGTVAVADGVVYALSYKKLNAYDAANGDLLWAFAGDAALSYPPVVAAGFVYVASDENVYAVEIATHAQRWTAAAGGWLAVAEGKLVIARSNGSLEAYRLTP